MLDSFVQVDLKKLENNVRNIIAKYPEYDQYIGVV